MEENKSCFHPRMIYTEEGSHTSGEDFGNIGSA